MLVRSDEFRAVGGGVRVWRSIGIAFHRDGWDRYCGRPGKSRFERGVSLFAIGCADPPSVVMDDDVDVIGVVERSCATCERRVVEFPGR